jgi:hypothetical protein
MIGYLLDPSSCSKCLASVKSGPMRGGPLVTVAANNEKR